MTRLAWALAAAAGIATPTAESFELTAAPAQSYRRTFTAPAVTTTTTTTIAVASRVVGPSSSASGEEIRRRRRNNNNTRRHADRWSQPPEPSSSSSSSYDGHSNNNDGTRSPQRSGGRRRGVGRYERLEYTIYPDGSVTQKVFGVKGPACLQLTQNIEAALGEVIYSAPTAEMFETDNDELQDDYINTVVRLSEEENGDGSGGGWGDAGSATW